MLTYQDLLAITDNEVERIAFVRKAIDQHKGTLMYKTAWIAEQYDKHRNVTINEYQKILYTVTGKAVPDNWSANYKMACRHFHRFIVQENQFLLGNGITWNEESTEDKLGTKKYPIDSQMRKVGRNALTHGITFGFYNLDHVEVFTVLEFVPLYDEENGALSAGIRFWQVAPNKPLRATLYEIDGYSEYKWDGKSEGEIVAEKRPYKLKYRASEVDGVRIYDGENYPSFPIVPCWGNSEKQSEIVGLREQIDCYDLIKSGFANTVDEASYVYWTLQNAGGMDDLDLTKFVERMKTMHAAVVEDAGAHAESHSQDAPFASREALLNRLDADLYRDAMALDIERIASGAVTATQIKAAYEPLNCKTDDFEYCVLQFLQGIMEIAGIDDEPTFTRSMLVNVSEEVQTILQAAQYLSNDYVTEKILTMLGDADRVDDILDEMDKQDVERFTGIEAPEEEEDEDIQAKE